MKKITILALDNSLSSSITGTMDIFSQAGLTWNTITGIEPRPFFEVEVVSREGRPVNCLNRLKINSHGPAEEVEKTDVIILSSIFDFSTLDSDKALLPWLKHHHENGTTIAAICTGSFFLARTGLLDGKTATTHWGFANEFKSMYPGIHLLPRKLITDEGSLLCSGACNSHIDLSVYLIERYCGNRTAVECSKTMIHDYGRDSQAPYAVFRRSRDHHDKDIAAIQEFMEKNLEKPYQPETLANSFGMSRRTFERRFKNATGHTPLYYLHQIRVENVKLHLETSNRSFDEIAYQTGYEDSGFLRKVFKKHTGLLPSEYRGRFQR